MCCIVQTLSHSVCFMHACLEIHASHAFSQAHSKIPFQPYVQVSAYSQHLVHARMLRPGASFLSSGAAQLLLGLFAAPQHPCTYSGEFNLTTTVQYLKYLITIFAIPTDQALHVYCLCSPFHTLPHKRKYILGTLLIGRQEIWTHNMYTLYYIIHGMQDASH